jgi:hypothetical protein
MASANLELVRSIIAPWEKGDHSSVDWAAPQIEFVVADGPAPGSWTGVAGMARAFRDYIDVWEDARVATDEFRELDGERILVLVGRIGRGKTSGLEFTGMMRTQGAIVFDVQGSIVSRLVLYFDRERACADLGLSQEGDP